MVRWRTVAIDPVEEQLRGSPSHGRWILGDDRDARLEEIGEQDVVEPHQRDLRMKPQPAERPARSDRDEVLSGEEGSGRPRHREELGDRGLGAFGPAYVEPHHAVDLEVLRRNLLDVAAMALDGGRDRVQVPEVPDAPVTLAGQVADPAPNPLGVVGEYGVGVKE